MVKVIGITLIMCTTIVTGIQIGNSFAIRVKEIRQLILSIQLMETEMSYSHLPLQAIFLRISEKVDQPLRLFYNRMALVLDASIDNFGEHWEAEWDTMEEKSELKAQEIEVMKQFGRTLGTHSIVQQKKHIKLTMTYLEKVQEEAIERKQRYEKMSKTLGILIGLVVVILFF